MKNINFIEGGNMNITNSTQKEVYHEKQHFDHNNIIISEKNMNVQLKLTKTEKKFISWLANEISSRKKNIYILYDQKWIVATQEKLAKELGVTRRTICSVTKKLLKLGIIEEEKLSMEFSNKYPKDGYYRDHTYSYALTSKGREMIDSTFSQHDTSLVNAYDCNDIIEGVTIKLTKSEKKVIRWLENSLSRGENLTYILNNKKWAAAPQEVLAKELDLSAWTICSAIKRLMQYGIIERDHTYHIYSYTLKGWKMADSQKTDSNVKRNAEKTQKTQKSLRHFTSNPINDKSFIYKSIINHDSEIRKKDTREELKTTTVNRDIPLVEELKATTVETPPKTSPVVTVREMYDVIKEVLGEKVSCKLTTEISSWIGKARNTYFQTLDKWRRFLETIKRSCFLMGEKFLLTIKWILKFKTIEKILAGEYDSFEEKKKRRAKEWNRKLEEEREKRKEREEEMAIELENSTENPKCKEAMHELRNKLGTASFMSWFKKANWVEEHGKVIVEVESDFQFDMIESRYSDELKSLGIGLRKVNRKLEEEREKRKEREEEMAIELENSTENPKCLKARRELRNKVGIASLGSVLRKVNV